MNQRNFLSLTNAIRVAGAIVLGSYSLNRVLVMVIMMRCRCCKNGSGFAAVPKYDL